MAIQKENASQHNELDKNKNSPLILDEDIIETKLKNLENQVIDEATSRIAIRGVENNIRDHQGDLKKRLNNISSKIQITNILLALLILIVIAAFWYRGKNSNMDFAQQDTKLSEKSPNYLLKENSSTIIRGLGYAGYEYKSVKSIPFYYADKSPIGQIVNYSIKGDNVFGVKKDGLNSKDDKKYNGSIFRSRAKNIFVKIPKAVKSKKEYLEAKSKEEANLTGQPITAQESQDAASEGGGGSNLGVLSAQEFSNYLQNFSTKYSDLAVIFSQQTNPRVNPQGLQTNIFNYSQSYNGTNYDYITDVNQYPEASVSRNEDNTFKHQRSRVHKSEEVDSIREALNKYRHSQIFRIFDGS